MNHQSANYNNPYYSSSMNEYSQIPDALNRSPPGATRPYGTIGGTGQGRRGLEGIGRGFQASMQQYSDDSNRLSHFSSDRLDQTGLSSNSYALDNMQNWAHNAATINGAMNGANRFRNNGRRSALPSGWGNTGGDMGQSTMGSGHLFATMGGHSHMGMNGMQMGMDAYGSAGMIGRQDEQIIPTAIVIKNIPFSVRKEQLAALMAEMALPQPYAFNYHFDSGVFRGLAFANFQSAEETAQVIAAMNQMDVNGRKLRVEYKKMLPEHERERIEREKREKRGQLQEQHQPLTAHQQSSMPQLSASIAGNPVAKSGHLRDVDMNDPETLDIYTELTLFKSDAAREVLIFPPNMTPEARRKAHILAHNLSLYHQSLGAGENRQLQIYKRNPTSPVSALPAVSYDSSRRGLSRAATIDFAESRMAASGNTGFHPISRPGPTLELPGSPDASNGGMINNLRAAKSFADLRSFSPSPSPSTGSVHPTTVPHMQVARFGEYSANIGPAPPSTPGTGSNNPTPSSTVEPALAGLIDSMHISGGYESATGLPRPRDNLGTIGSQRPSANGQSKAPSRPESDWPAFPGRRANGHMPRGSDSSDNTRDGRSGGSRIF